MIRMNKNNLRIATAIIVSGLGVFISYLINFLLTPYITDNIGIEAYGFVSLAKNFVNYAQIATIAITSFVVRYISVSYHERKMQEANEYYSTSVIACVALAGVIFISALLLITKIDLLLNVPQNLIFSVKLLFLIVFLNFVLTTATTPFTTAAYIKNRLDITGIIKIIAYLVDAGVMVILFITCTPNVWFVGMGSLAASVVTFICTYILSKKLVPELIFNKDFFSVSKLKNLVGNGIWNSLNSLGNELNSGLDLIISNLFLNGVATGQIAVVKTIGTMFSMLYEVVYQPFQPNLIKAYASGDVNVFINEQKKAMRICGYFSNVAFAGFVALGGLYYKLWLPSEDTKLLHVLTIVTVLGSVTAGVMRPIYYVYTLTLKNKLPCWITIAGGFLNVVSMYVLLKYTQMGVYAIVSTTTVIMLCINLFFNPVYAAYNLKISVKVYYKVIFKHLISAAIMVGGFIGIARVIRPSGWIGLIASAIIMCISGLIIHVLIMCNMDEKLFLIKKITKRK